VRSQFPVQSTSIPGVAQRTGSTTYYIEIMPVSERELGGRRPMFALVPGIGDIDVMVASELMEAVRAVAGGFVTRDRTLMIASTSRIYAMTEKTAMGDGRHDSGRLVKAIEDNAQGRLLLDMEEIARANGVRINAIMLGVVAGCGRLPINAETFEAAIRAEGKGGDANLKGFRLGLAAARDQLPAPVRRTAKRASARAETPAALEAGIAANVPAACAGSRPIRMSPTHGSILIGSLRSVRLIAAPGATASSSPRPRGISRYACRSRM
jgi:indolepyruvate ferredoxin oxidoreductase, beta subunit